MIYFLFIRIYVHHTMLYALKIIFYPAVDGLGYFMPPGQLYIAVG